MASQVRLSAPWPGCWTTFFGSAKHYNALSAARVHLAEHVRLSEPENRTDDISRLIPLFPFLSIWQCPVLLVSDPDATTASAAMAVR